MHLSNTLTWYIDNDENNYPKEVKKIFFQNRIKLRKKYNNWVGEISKKFSNDIDWWVSVPGSRNPYFSEIYKIICLLETIKRLKSKKILIFTNSKIVQSLTRAEEEYSRANLQSLVRDLDGVITKLNSSFQDEVKQEIEAKSFFLDS